VYRIFHPVTIAGFDQLRADHQQYQAPNSDFVVSDAGKYFYLFSTAASQELKIPPEVILRENLNFYT